MNDILTTLSCPSVPSQVTPPVRFCQIVALVITSFTQDLLRTGLLEGIKGFVPETVGQAFPLVNRTRWNMSCFFRCLEGSMGLIVTFILIMTAETVLDLLLNFTGKSRELIGFSWVESFSNPCLHLCTSHGICEPSGK